MIEGFGSSRRLQLPPGKDAEPRRGSMRFCERTGCIEAGTGDYRVLLASAAVQQPQWYVDAATGNDANLGDTPSTALATLNEWARRIGRQRAVVTMTVDVLTDLELTDDLVIEGDFPLGLTIRGVPTVVRSGAFTATTAYDFSTLPGSSGSIESAGGFAGDLYAPLRIVGGARDGAIGWVLADLGGDAAQYGPFYRYAELGEVTPQAGDAYEVLRLPVIRGRSVVFDGASSGFRTAGNTILVELLDIRGDEPEFVQGLWVSCGLLVVHSRINGHGNYFAAPRPRFVGLAGCFFGGYSASTFPGRFYNDGLLVSCTWLETGPQARAPAALVDFYGTHVGLSAGGNGGTMAARQGRLRLQPGSVWAYYGLSSAARGIVEVWEQGSVRLAGKVGGTGNTAGYGLWVGNGGRLSWPAGDDFDEHMGPTGGVTEVQVAAASTTYAAVGSSTLADDEAAIYPATEGPA